MIIDSDELGKDARARKIPVMLDGGMEILIETLKRVKPLRILEIGTAVGYSGIRMLKASPENAVLDTIEIDADRFGEARENFRAQGLSSRVNQYLGDCLVVLPEVINGKVYDFVFIDAAKSKYLDCLKAVTGAVSSKGAIVADNVYFRGLVMSPDPPPKRYRAIVKNLRKFLDYALNSGLYDVEIFAEGDGVAVIRPKAAIRELP